MNENQNHCACCDDSQDEGKFHISKDIILIVVSLVLFTIGMILKGRLHETPFSIGEYGIFLLAYFLCGYNVLSAAVRNVFRGNVLDENSLMSIATLGAILIHELPEAVGVMLFFKVGEFFQGLSVSRARRSIKSLLAARPDYANLKFGDEIKKV